MTAPATTRHASTTEAITIIRISLYIVSPPVLHDKDIYLAIVYSHTAGLGSSTDLIYRSVLLPYLLDGEDSCLHLLPSCETQQQLLLQLHVCRN